MKWSNDGLLPNGLFNRVLLIKRDVGTPPVLRWLWGWQRFQAAFGCGIGSLKTLWVVRQGNFYAQACGEVLAVVQGDAAAVTLSDGLGDGQPEPCALFVATEDAVEGVKYALAFGGGDAVAVVFYDDGGAALLALGG